MYTLCMRMHNMRYIQKKTGDTGDPYTQGYLDYTDQPCLRDSTVFVGYLQTPVLVYNKMPFQRVLSVWGDQSKFCQNNWHQKTEFPGYGYRVALFAYFKKIILTQYWHMSVTYTHKRMDILTNT